MKRYVLTNYAIQCRDERSGFKGSFIFDLEKYAETGKFFAISPVFDSLYDLYRNTDPSERKSCYVEYTGN